jgi:signal peptidase II
VTQGQRRIPSLSLLVAAVVVGLDQLSKHWAVSQLNDGHTVHVLWTLQFNLAFNSGMAFGGGQGLGPFIGVIAVVVVVFLLLSLRQASGKLSVVAIGLIVGGAMGNIVDRLFREDAWLHGRVVDFIDFQWFPIFNIADMCVNVGGGLLIVSYLFFQPKVDHV